MTWFQAAYDPNDWREPWVVLQMHILNDGRIAPSEVSRWPTKHEAEGHARKHWEALR